MRVLLDECMPRRLKRELPDHIVVTVPEAGWAAKKNGELLRLAGRDYDVFITVDRRIPFQQRLDGVALSVIVLVAKNNRFATLRPLMAEVRAIIAQLRPGDVVHIGA